MRNALIIKLLLAPSLILIYFNIHAQDSVLMDKSQETTVINKSAIPLSPSPSYVFDNYNLEDPSNSLTIKDILTPNVQNKFQPAIDGNNTVSENANSTYWVKFKINNYNDQRLILTVNFLFEDVHLFIPTNSGRYSEIKSGLYYPLSSRKLKYKDPSFILPEHIDPSTYYYISLKSKANIGISLDVMPFPAFYNTGINNYFYYGSFFGIVIVIGIYNFILFLIAKERAYVYYGMYILCFGIFAIVDWGFIKLIFPNASFEWNNNFWTIPFSMMTIFLLLYAKHFFDTAHTVPLLNKIITILVIARIAFLILGIALNANILSAPFIDIAFLSAAYIAGVVRLRGGFSPAKYFLSGFSILLIGLLIHTFHVTRYLDFSLLPYITVANVGVVELIFFSLALSGRFKLLKQEKENAQLRIIEQLKENEVLKDKVNSELEIKVAERIAELKKANEKLEEQAIEIERMNMLLMEDKKYLELSVKKLSKARVMEKGVNFDEFLQIYPDEDACLSYLAELKWSNGFTCKKCRNTKFSTGKIPYSRKCSRCNFIETVTSSTIFSGVKFSILKAFYIVFLQSWDKELTIDETSKILNLRRNTCWAFKKKVIEAQKHAQSEHKADKLLHIILSNPKEEV